MILGILQARVSSSRLPGKVLKPILGVPMILRQIERLRRSKTLDGLVLATSVDASDDPLAELAAGKGIEVCRGPLEDVLGRFILAAKAHRPEWIVRLTGDCPLVDPAIIDRVVTETLRAGVDYGSNTIHPTYPDGLDVEVVKGEILLQIAGEDRTVAEREHVTLAIHRRPDRFRLHSVEDQVDRSSMRWTVDEPADFDLIDKIYAELYPKNPDFRAGDVFSLLGSMPELAAINRGFERNEGLAKSLARESVSKREK